MTRLLIYYSFVLVTIMTIVGFVGANSFSEYLSSLLFFPLAIFFGLIALPQSSHSVKVLKKDPKSTPLKGKLTTLEPEKTTFDTDRRKFIKLIGSAGIAMLLFAVVTKRAHGAFFGSVPGPGTVALKDSSGGTVDPAISTPTDGYKITEIDDSSATAYYGFVEKTGKWFIMQEQSGGAYRYTKGAADFTNATTGWPNRASLSYGYFDAIF